MKYHISPSTGNPNRCYANTKPCPIGGEKEHYSSKEEARSAFEKTQTESKPLKKLNANDTRKTNSHVYAFTEDGKEAITFEQREEFKSLHSKIHFAPTPSLNKKEIKVLENLAEGRNVTNEDLDRIIDRLEETTVETHMNTPEKAATNKKVVDYLKLERKRSGVPSTLPTAVSFDPTTQTMFSNKDARKHPAILSKALRRQSAHMEWMNELADERANSIQYAETPEERKYTENEVALYRGQARRAEAKLHAQFRELQYLYDTDEDFRARLNLPITKYLKQGWYREPDVRYNGIPIDGVKKA